jgi:hypothetical protein
LERSENGREDCQICASKGHDAAWNAAEKRNKHRPQQLHWKALELGEIRGFVQRGQSEYLRTYQSRAGERLRRFDGCMVQVWDCEKDKLTISAMKVID